MQTQLTETSDIFSLLKVLDELKHLKRTGWTKFNIPEPETVACHMYRMAVLAMLMNGDCDRAKCIRMTLVHDLAEAIVGDITPHCGISAGEKHQLEDEAMKKIMEMVPLTAGEDWYSLWQEYEGSETKEAKIVKHLDKFDMIVQAFHYEQKYGAV
uniref:5'-deoxynucleotidase HDDC2 n=1 Tax=Loa loa TaxID=7209 RepID=A0A1I7VGM5_LOALO